MPASILEALLNAAQEQCSSVHPAPRHVQDRTTTIALKDQEGDVQVTGTTNWARTLILIQVQAIEVTFHLETLHGQSVLRKPFPNQKEKEADKYTIRS